MTADQIYMEEFVAWARDNEVDYSIQPVTLMWEPIGLDRMLRFVVMPARGIGVYLDDNTLYEGHSIEEAIAAYNAVCRLSR